MAGMFNKCNKLKEIKGLNNFDTSNVINIYGLFNQCINLEYLDLSKFNISKTYIIYVQKL